VAEAGALIVLAIPFIVFGSFLYWGKDRRRLPEGVTEYLRTVPPVKSSTQSWMPGTPHTRTEHRVRCTLEDGKTVEDVVVRDCEFLVRRPRYLWLRGSDVRRVEPVVPA
jgi:hypothetical protein